MGSLGRKDECVLVQVGQCGNQLGAAWLDYCWESSASAWFRPAGENHRGARARCVLVDSEPRTVGSAVGGHGSAWSYEAKHRLCAGGGRGAGNNWASGYRTAATFVECVEDSVRREVERCQSLGGVLTLASGCGGTGSGLGCAVAEALDDGLALGSRLVHGVVLGGDVTVAPLNASLTLTRLLDPHRRSGVLAMDNADALASASSRLSGISSGSRPAGSARPTLADLNRALCRDVLAPAFLGVGPRYLDHVAADPRYHLLLAAASRRRSGRASSRDLVSADVADLARRVPRAFHTLVLATTASASSGDSSSHPAEAPRLSARNGAQRRAHRLDDSDPCLDPVRARCRRLRLATYAHLGPDPDDPRGEHIATRAALLGAGANVTRLEQLAATATAMVQAKAFVHHYERRGVSLDVLENAALRLYDLAHDYAALAANEDENAHRYGHSR